MLGNTNCPAISGVKRKVKLKLNADGLLFASYVVFDVRRIAAIATSLLSGRPKGQKRGAMSQKRQVGNATPWASTDFDAELGVI